ncbi:MAG: redoxin domain-containing protein [Proteobacteria bacterium]|nr:redoxin domain-containing protein [Pseudomonadota bacterium]
MPSIEALHRHFKGQGLAVLTVSVDVAQAEIVRAFVQKHNYTFTVLHDPQGKIMEWFHVRLIPVTYVINK